MNRSYVLLSYKAKATALIFILTLLLSSCEKKKEEKPLPKTQRPPITIEIALHESIKEPVKEILTALQPQLKGDRDVVLDIQTFSKFNDAKKISVGNKKNDLWITPASFQVDWANNNLRNLGARHEKCTPLARSPLVLVTTKKLGDKVCEPDKPCRWETIISFLSDPSTKPKHGYSRMLAHMVPQYSPISLLAWSNLHYWDGVFTVGDNGKLHDLGTEPRWNFLSQRTVATNTELLDKIANAHTEEQVIGVVAKSDLQQYLAKKRGGHELVGIEIAGERSFAKEITACISKGDWVTPIKYGLLSKILKSLSSESSLEKYRSLGYSTEINSAKRSVKDGEIHTLSEKRWEKYRKPPAFTLVVDASASMTNEGRIYDVQRALRLLVATPIEGATYSLIRFSEETEIITPFSSDKDKLLKRLDRIKPLGGSAVYDALAYSFQHAIRGKNDATRRVIFITDGGDINSKLAEKQARQILKLRSEFREVDLTLVSLANKKNNSSDLKELAKVANGKFIELPSPELDSFIQTLAYP